MEGYILNTQAQMEGADGIGKEEQGTWDYKEKQSLE